MEFLADLWLPILVSAVLVFVVSSVVHMVFKYHLNDMGKLANEEEAMAALRSAGVQPGNYRFPYCASMQEMATDEFVARMNQGPVGYLTVLPNGPIHMGKALGQWFVYCVVVGVFVAYIGSLAMAPGAELAHVLRITGTAAFLAYAMGEPLASIWKGQSWSTTAKYLLDGLLYAVATGLVFGWLWPGVA